MATICVEKNENDIVYLVASRDIRPGEKIWREDKPLILCPEKNLDKYTRADKEVEVQCIAHYIYTNFVSSPEKQRLRALFAPCPKLHADKF